jgi:hypothetical protein
VKPVIFHHVLEHLGSQRMTDFKRYLVKLHDVVRIVIEAGQADPDE